MAEQGDGLDPLREVIDHDQDIFTAAARDREPADDVNADALAREACGHRFHGGAGGRDRWLESRAGGA